MMSSVLAELQKLVTPTPPLNTQKNKAHHQSNPIKTTYESLPIDLPPDFLATEPGITPVPTLTEIDWATTDLPENKGLYAVVLDGVLTRDECDELRKLAEGSVPLEKWVEEQDSPKKTPWAPALVNVGLGYEVLTPSYRNSSRIIWDQQEVVDRLWARCCLVPGLMERLAVLDAGRERDVRIITGRSLPCPAADEGDGKQEVERYANGKKKGRSKRTKTKGLRDGRTGKWEFVKVNKRMRFLRYGEGQFFRAHCDSPYRELDPINSDRINETMFTIHLYLNDCKSEAPPDKKDETELVGGATALLSGDEKRKYDVECKTGRVLIFQHRRVFHAGADVVKGVKYSVRTDIMYREVLEEPEKQEVVETSEQAEKEVDDKEPLKEDDSGK
ncbi:uncharacterized protein B0T23DRAFT_371687 [Neurospora hispaniola]|uniref:Prolyl 4-hydroxylase alpha subunit domain-containing protein n=1 Tax=Neurospora hispaniola TaxID=588809 RepID=A0AAJ0MVW9_9PEZI|nr:hypothetical protein B0T23DRAFT_371687 [Neurospora hispaniola]